MDDAYGAGEEDPPCGSARAAPGLLDATAGALRHGLIFVCFAGTISTQFEFITRGWTTNPNFPTPGTGPGPLRSYEQVIAGGYFFVPPVRTASKLWTWMLPETPAAS